MNRKRPKGARALRPRPHSRYLSTDNNQKGFSAIAPNFWQTAEKLRSEAVQATAQQAWKTHWSVPSAICLYHAALDCFINEEIASALAGTATDTVLTNGRAIQDLTLCKEKLERFVSFFGLDGKQTPNVQRRALLFLGLRDRLYHHSPEMRDMREYPDQVIAALKDAGIQPVNTSWAGQCMNVQLTDWASKVVRAFIEDWCRAGGIESRMKLPGWEYVPSNAAPSEGASSWVRRVASWCQRALRP
jgi:hypothetical protein